MAKDLAPKIEKQARTSIILIQHITGSSSNCNGARKRYTRHADQKKDIKLFLFEVDIIVYIKKVPQKSKRETNKKKQHTN